MNNPIIFAALFATGFGLAMPALAQAEAVEMALKEVVTNELGEGEIIDFADGSQMVGADYFTVYIEGEGPDVLLIPGLSTPRAVWEKTRNQLKGRFKVHTIQTRGFGDAAPTETLTPEARSLLDTYAFHLADYIDDYVIRISEGQNPAIIGHSMGGLVAMKIAANMGHQVDRVMVIDRTPFLGSYFGPEMTTETIKPHAAVLRDSIAGLKMGEAYDEVPASMSATVAGLEQLKKWANTADPKVIAQFTYDDLTTDIRAELDRINVPMTVLYSYDASMAEEAVLDEFYKNSFANAKTAKLQRIDDSRHFIMLDQPEKFAEAVELFLSQ